MTRFNLIVPIPWNRSSSGEQILRGLTATDRASFFFAQTIVLLLFWYLCQNFPFLFQWENSAQSLKDFSSG